MKNPRPSATLGLAWLLLCFAGSCLTATPALAAPADGRIVVGNGFTCAIIPGDTVKCWGANDYGQLVDGSTLSHITAVDVAGLSHVAAISGQNDHVCALIDDGSVKCWGDNLYGQLGNGKSGYGDFATTPQAVAGISQATAISAGLAHACAVLADGSARCWGSNGSGQLDSGASGGIKTAPVAVSGLTGATSIAAGGSHTCHRRFALPTVLEGATDDVHQGQDVFGGGSATSMPSTQRLERPNDSPCLSPIRRQPYRRRCRST